MIVGDPTRIRNLNNCIEEVAINFGAGGPRLDFSIYVRDLPRLKNDLRQAASSLTDIYREAVSEPFLVFLNRLDPNEFAQLFISDYRSLSKSDQVLRDIIQDIAAAIFANCGPRERCASSAFQEVVSDLYEGFMCEEDREGVKPPDKSILPPLVSWGRNPSDGPYTWTIAATSGLGLKAPIVSLPAPHANGGLLGWTTLGHEVGGHDILDADTGLLDELKDRVYSAVFRETQNKYFADYWRNCTGETASDILGILNMGPAAAIGLIGYFRAFNYRFNEENPVYRLRNKGDFDDPHPVDVLRGFIAADIVSQLQFSQAQEWSRIIKGEATRDLQDSITVIYGNSCWRVGNDVAIKTAKIAANTIANARLESLEGHSLREIQNWTDYDERIRADIKTAIWQGKNLPQDYQGRGYYATHVVAATVTGALESDINLQQIQDVFDRMKRYLIDMHDGEYTPQRVAYLNQASGRNNTFLSKLVSWTSGPNGSIFSCWMPRR